jgi:hypothetical protein
LPGSWLTGTQAGFATANEEAAHAYLSTLLGIPVLEVRIDSPIREGPDCRGIVTTVPDLDRLWEHLLAVLAGPISVGREVPWPPDIAAGADEEVCALLVPRLGLDEAQFTRAKNIVKGYLFDLPTSRRALRAVSERLLERGALTGDEVRVVIAEAAGAETGNGKASDDDGDDSMTAVSPSAARSRE